MDATLDAASDVERMSPSHSSSPPSLALRLRRLLEPAWRGTLWRTQPVSAEWGFDRGTPVDRHFIERFLAANAADIRGRALEVANSDYLRRFGTSVEAMDVLDIDASNPRATIVADLTRADHIPSNSFDCIVLTQTLHIIYDLRAAIAHVHRILRPGGVLLVTVPAVSKISASLGPDRDYWRFTPGSVARLFGTAFGTDVTVRSYGNVLAAVAFLSGLAAEDLDASELAIDDELFPVIVSVRARKAG
jgi:SAM-dependent methyltransferase